MPQSCSTGHLAAIGKAATAASASTSAWAGGSRQEADSKAWRLIGKIADADAEPDRAAAPERDELEEYLSSPLETDMDLDLLAYWKLKESTWPKLAKMAKQYLAAPFSSAGVERVFSAAGKMHDDLRKSAKDSTLEHSLFAAFNCD